MIEVFYFVLAVWPALPQETGAEPAESALQRAEAAIKARNLEEAVALFTQYTETHPDDLEGWTGLGKVNIRLKRNGEAIAAFEKALALKPEDPELLQLLGETYSLMGDQPKASQFFGRAMGALATGNKEDAEGLYKLSSSFLRMGESQRAVQVLNMALVADPNHAKSHYQLGLLFYWESDMANSKKHLEKYLRLEPKGGNSTLARELLASMGKR